MSTSKAFSTLGVLFIVAGSQTLFAQGRETFGAWFPSRAGEALPISTLPKEISASEGQLTLYADYSKSSEKSVQLYLINRTEHRVAFSSQDSDLYTKLEALTENGIWERAQTHVGSDCGNSYSHRILRPNEYFRFAGYFPSEGEERPIRYRLLRDYALIVDDGTDEQQVSHKHYKKDLRELPIKLVTNEGTGRVSSANIEAAKRDGWAASFGTFETVRDLAMGIIIPNTRGSDRSAAVQALGRFPTNESLALLKDFLTDPDPNIPPAAMSGISKMGLDFEPADQLYQELLRSDDAKLKFLAIVALEQRVASPAVIQFAKDQLSDDDFYVRIAAMRILALQCKNDPETKAFLNAAYDDPNPKIRSIFETMLFPTCIEKDKEGKPRGLRPKESP